MADRRLERIRRLVLQGSWRVSSHVLAYIEDGEFAEGDLECSILNGRITESQRDDRGGAVDARKYTICGQDLNGLPLETVGKIVEGYEGHEYFIITAYQRR